VPFIEAFLDDRVDEWGTVKEHSLVTLQKMQVIILKLP
jgi:hypothetical protein